MIGSDTLCLKYGSFARHHGYVCVPRTRCGTDGKLCYRRCTSILVLAVGVKYWNKQGGKCLCEEQDKERLFSFLGILGSE